MFDPEKLLGHVLRQAAGGGMKRKKKRKYSGGYGSGGITGLGRGVDAKIGMGVLGLAFAAFEHFRDKPGQPSAAGPMPMPSSPPPPPPGATSISPPPPPPPGAPTPDAQRERNALHLLRVMIAAAYADSVLDDEERQDILDRGREAGLQGEDLEALQREMAAPLSLAQVLAQTAPSLRDEAYAAARIAVDGDSQAEQDFLDQLAQGLGLDAAARAQIDAQLGIGP